MELAVRREEELRRSEEIQKLYTEAENSELTDWIGVTMKLRAQVLDELGITGPNRFTFLEYAARKYKAFYVTQNLAKRCLLEIGMEFPCLKLPVYHMGSQKSCHLGESLNSLGKPYHLLISGSIS